MTIPNNKVASIHYTTKLESGKVEESTIGQHPYSFLGSSDQMFQKVEDRIAANMKVGDKETIVLAPEDAYGQYFEEGCKVTRRDNFPKDAELKEGLTFLTMQEGHEVPVRVTKVEGDDVTIDFNHPLAGESISFELELLELRDATDEEMKEGHIHGPGCSH